MPDYYETDAQVNEYLVFHYADSEQTLPWEFGPHRAFGFHARRALDKLAGIANPGAQLVVCSPFTWWDEFTIPEERLGGFSHNGADVTSHDSIVSALEPNFRLKTTCDLPFLIREHERKFHFSVAQTSIWIRLDN